ncbi:uncharacterized mitochondrial protein AtMg00820-like [Humulus lupulus]|uniref:uncharacterized mitochondrial protein AtMg00820-like n=1 Tax=Humulus lupulus TaxID=3486 RepID=UPI002B40D541|nr:uncharacterized mitochondrial protein AtMg00820-like [Humulus lupulus]
MVTRSKARFYKPKVYITSKEPLTLADAIGNSSWKSAMEEETQSLNKNGTWSLLQLPSNRKSIGCKWVFKIKENPDGTILKNKARLVANRSSQQFGFDFTETFSPIIKPTTIQAILTIALSYNW